PPSLPKTRTPLEYLKRLVVEDPQTHQVIKPPLFCFRLRIELQVLIKIKSYGQ
ncbi:hypothetical protein TorRG33x02_268880, partial [Trema orientale]